MTSLTTLQAVLAAASGLGAGLLSGFFGVGGNVVLVPLLALVLGLPQHEAQGLTLAALLPPLGAPAVWQYHRQGVRFRWKVVGCTITGFVAAIPLGSLGAAHLPATALRLLFAVLLVNAGLRAWRGQGAQPALHEETPLPPRWPLLALAAGFGAGLASGLLGIGGAIVLIPMLTRFLHLSQREAQLTSLVMLLPPIALPGVLVYWQTQAALPWGALVPVALGFAVGALIGGGLSQRLSAQRLERGFAVLLFATAVGLVARTLA